MKTEDRWGVLSGHSVDVLNESGMLKNIRNHVDELSDLLVEAVVLSKASVIDPQFTIGVEHDVVLSISDSSTILDLGDHVLHSNPRVRLSKGGGLVHVVLAIKERSLKISSVELIGFAETKSTELSSLLYDGVQEAEGEDDGSPLVIRLNLLEEVLVDHGVESLEKTSLETLWRLNCDLNSHLEETKRELFGGLASNPKSEVRINDFVLGVKNVLHSAHVLNSQVTVGKDNPRAGDEGVVNGSLGRKFLTFSHGCDSRGLRHLLLSSKFFNHACGIGTSSKQVKNRLVDVGFLPDLLDLIGDWLDKLSSESIRDEHIGGNHGSIFS
jgi:hypothetical protein